MRLATKLILVLELFKGTVGLLFALTTNMFSFDPFFHMSVIVICLLKYFFVYFLYQRKQWAHRAFLIFIGSLIAWAGFCHFRYQDIIGFGYWLNVGIVLGILYLIYFLVPDVRAEFDQ